MDPMPMPALRKHVLYHPPVDIGQAKPAPLKLVVELFVIDAQQMQERRLEIEHVHALFSDVIAQDVGVPVDDDRLHAATGHPERKALGMMVPAEIVRRQLNLAVVGSAELSSPDD